jgi:hypothetical protein
MVSSSLTGSAGKMRKYAKHNHSGAKTALRGTIGEASQKERVPEILIPEPFRGIAGAGFEPATFGL